MCRQYWTIFFKSSIPVCLSQWLSNFLNHKKNFRFRNRSTSYSDEILPSLCFRNSRTHMMQNNPQLLMSSNSLSHFHWIGPRYLNYRWVAASRPNITIVTFIPAKKKKEKLKQRTDSYIQHRYELRSGVNPTKLSFFWFSNFWWYARVFVTYGKKCISYKMT